MAMISPVDMGALPSFGWGRPLGFPADGARTRRTRLRPAVALRRTPTARCRPPTWSRTPRRPGMRLMALTDHDTVDGVAEALARRARARPALLARRRALERVGRVRGPARLRLRAAPRRPGAARHARGLPRRPRPPDLGDGRPAGGARLRARPQPSCARARRAGAPLGRPHLADAVLAHPGNAAKLRAEGIDGKNTLFPPYLVPGAVAYVARSRPTVEEAIDVIHAAGGVAVWAHPFWDIDDPDDRARRDRRASRPRGSTASRSSTPPTTRSRRRTLYEAATRARAARHRLGRLPRARARALQPLRRASSSTGSSRVLGPIGA